MTTEHLTTAPDSYTVAPEAAKALRLKNSLRAIEEIDIWLPKLAGLLSDDSDAVTTVALVEDLIDSLRRGVLDGLAVREYSRDTTTCAQKGCDQPRYATEVRTYHLCRTHILAYWRREGAKRYGKERG